MNVTYFQRKPGTGYFSIERLFEDIRTSMPEDIDVNVCVNRYPSKGIWRRLYDIFRARRYQGNINHITGDIHFLTFLLIRRKTILTIHDCATLERLGGIRYWVFWFLWYWLPSKRCAVITVISDSTKKELERYLTIKNLQVEVIPDCVSPEFRPTEQIFNTKCPRILQVGTKANKNLERVAAALDNLSCQLVIIGELSPSQRNTLRTHKINYTNHVDIDRDNMIMQYQQADLVMFVSLYEGFGLPILEANAVGRPVITSRLYSMPDVGGDGAYYVDPYKVHEIRSAVERIRNDSNCRKELIENGFKNVRKYKPQVIASQYAELYRRIFDQV